MAHWHAPSECFLSVFSQEPQHVTAEVIIDVLTLGDEVTIHNPMILENYEHSPGITFHLTHYFNVWRLETIMVKSEGGL